MVKDCFYSNDAGYCELYTGGIRDDLCIENGKCACQQDPAPSCSNYTDLVIDAFIQDMLQEQQVDAIYQQGIEIELVSIESDPFDAISSLDITPTLRDMAKRQEIP